MRDYFASSSTTKIITVKPSEIVPIDEGLEKQTVKDDEPVHGIYAFVIDQPAEVSVVQTIKLTYSPPGASCLPTPLVFIPLDLR